MTTIVDRVYLDNAASTRLDPEVLDYMLPFMRQYMGNPSSTHTEGRTLRAELEKARRTIARCLKVEPGEICFTSGGTEADNLAICGAVRAYGLKHIISTRIEHHAVIHTIEALAERGEVEVTWLTVDALGHISLDQLDRVLAEKPRSLVSLMHGNNEIGTLNDLDAIGEICARHNALFHSDTVQTMGHLPLDPRGSGIHFLTASAHKFYGPKGVGFLFIDRSLQVQPILHGGSQERKLRAGTENVASIMGMAFALEKCYAELTDKTRHLRDLRTYMHDELVRRLPAVQFNGETDPARALPTVLNVAPPVQQDDAMLLFHLDLQGIAASGGSACSSGAQQGSAVLRALGHDERRCRNSVRFSFGRHNTRADVDRAVAVLCNVLQPVAMST